MSSRAPIRSMASDDLKLFAFGNVARGVFAFGNVAFGVVSFGGSLSVGVFAFGGNAVGSLVAVGGNAVAPISVGLINALGVLTFAGVNGGGVFTGVGVNDGSSVTFGFVFALASIIGLVVGRSLFPPPIEAPDLRSLTSAEAILGGEEAGGWIRARLARVDPGALLARAEGRDVELGVEPALAELGQRILAESPRVLLRVEARDVPAAGVEPGYRAAPATARSLACLEIEADPAERPSRRKVARALVLGSFVAAAAGSLAAAAVRLAG